MQAHGEELCDGSGGGSGVARAQGLEEAGRLLPAERCLSIPGIPVPTWQASCTMEQTPGSLQTPPWAAGTPQSLETSRHPRA